MNNARIRKKLTDRKNDGLYRSLTLPAGTVDFTSNDYLGLARSEELFQQIQEKTSSLGHINGATGSRLLSGNSAYTDSVEQKLAGYFKSEASLIFNSGYTANLAVLSSLPMRGDTILLDELAHACIRDGARLSLARNFNFRHNDLNDLEQKLKRAEGRIFIAVESIYSMDGDECPLNKLVALAEKYDASVILDEAHSTGTIGRDGNGLAVSLGLQDRIAVRVYTFGKAMGVHGACVAVSSEIKEYLINFARPFIYTTALPPHSVASIECAFNFLHDHPELQEISKHKISLFLSGIPATETHVASNSSIQTAIFPGNANVRQAALHLQQQGFDIRPILSPTVPAGLERLRICIHTYNSDVEIISLTSALNRLGSTR